MITGYNTDVRHNDVVYHVQTEDKGLSNPFIESLLYVGGQILANKRTGYAELMADATKGERAVMTLMDHQHRTMIAAIRAGKFDKRLAALRGVPAEPERQIAAADETIATPPAPSPRPPPSMAVQPPPSMAVQPPPSMAVQPPTALEPQPAMELRPAMEPPPAAEPVPVETLGATVSDRTLDQVILDYLTNESQQEQLVLAIDNEGDLRGGQAVKLTVRASSSRSAQPLAGVKIVAKMISTFSGPMTLGDGETDDGGALMLAVTIPDVNRGTAAIIVTGQSAIGRSEYKHLL